MIIIRKPILPLSSFWYIGPCHETDSEPANLCRHYPDPTGYLFQYGRRHPILAGEASWGYQDHEAGLQFLFPSNDIHNHKHHSQPDPLPNQAIQVSDLSLDNFIAWFVRRSAKACFAFDDRVQFVPPAAPDSPIHLYVHIPFCVQLCPYCSFHRYAFEEKSVREYFKALRQELQIYARMGFRFSSVYLGGGTPTVLMDELFETLAVIRDLFNPAEISLETNPDRLANKELTSLARAGVRRVSVGIQSFSDEILKAIGRYEKYGSGKGLARKLKEASGSVETLNVDMIYNFPIQDSSMLENDLANLLDILPDQVTFYPLMISQATRKQMEHIMGKVSQEQGKRILCHDHIRA